MTTINGGIDNSSSSFSSGTASVTLKAGGLDQTFNNSLGSIVTTNAPVSVTADHMVLGTAGGGFILGKGDVTLTPFTASRRLILRLN